VFIEIKTAKNPSLSKRERDVRDCVQERRVGYKLLQIVPETEDLPIQEKNNFTSLPGG
jgi:predicted Holliday junction resolvase-like endonuclease